VRSFRLSAWLAACAAIILVSGTAILHIRSGRTVVPNTPRNVTSAESQQPRLGPLTIRRANNWLTTAASFKAAIDELAFPSHSAVIPKGQQSAVTVLSEEKIKL
jgi:hypothetical protein